MVKTVGVCGYFSTGSSAFVDLLHEFSETQVLDIEFKLAHKKYGLEDLEFYFKKYHSLMAISPFISYFISSFKRYDFFGSVGRQVDPSVLDKMLNDFVSAIISNSQRHSRGDCISTINFSMLKYIEKLISKCCPMIIKNVINKKVSELFYPNFNMMPEKFDEASRKFIINILSSLGINFHCTTKDIIVLNQSLLARDPIKSFKYFENPMAIIVDRDPRDHYLFGKFFLHSRLGKLCFPCDNVDNYIKWFRKMRLSPLDLQKQENVMLTNFEKLVYDFENTSKKVANFLGITDHIHKGEYFKPTHSRNNTQLFKKYSGCESDIKKIEQELPEYIFPFENYPDIKSEGGMFYGSQSRKLTMPLERYVREKKTK